MQIRGKRGKPSRYTVEDVQGMERMQRAGFRLQDIAAKYQCAVSTACEFINNAEEIMTHPNKRRGNDLEREIVNLATERGQAAEVDCHIPAGARSLRCGSISAGQEARHGADVLGASVRAIEEGV
jgi:hypothetical protein